MLRMLQNGLFGKAYATTPQVHLNNRVLYDMRGHIIGGSSSINGMVYDRGAAENYDDWAQLGNQGWSYADVLTYFRRAETYEYGESQYRGGFGPLHVSQSKVENPLARAWIEAGVEAGYPRNPDANAAQRAGFGPIDMTCYRGRRVSTATAYLHPALKRPNVTVVTEATVTRLIFDGLRAVGVEYTHHGQLHRAYAERETILSAGALCSPQILMLSGIGDGNHLSDHGVRTILDLKGVGKNLQEHCGSPIMVSASLPVSDYRYFNSLAGVLELGRYLLRGTGKLAVSPVESMGVVKTDIPGSSGPDVKLGFASAMVKSASDKLLKQHGFMVRISLMTPESRGEIKLQSNDPSELPAINPNCLAVEADRLRLRAAFKITRKILGQKAFNAYRGKEIYPGPEVSTDAEIDAFFRETAELDIHSACTCKMGNDNLSVVDDNLRVHGIQHLRVVDASVMPAVVSANTNAATIMIAEKAADLILA